MCRETSTISRHLSHITHLRSDDSGLFQVNHNVQLTYYYLHIFPHPYQISLSPKVFRLPGLKQSLSLLRALCVIAKQTQVRILRQTRLPAPLLTNCVIRSRPLKLLGSLSSFGNRIIVLIFFLPVVGWYIHIICPVILHCLPLWMEYTSSFHWCWPWPCDLIWLMEG